MKEAIAKLVYNEICVGRTKTHVQPRKNYTRRRRNNESGGKFGTMELKSYKMDKRESNYQMYVRKSQQKRKKKHLNYIVPLNNT